ncbi:hypothetical protein HRbin22_02203 [Candidatus Thermoflexus japonica]|uniref:Uncharacterized protein n=1 Tax=Candidatus Thermoflexus japonica TaxID=2035417 RepID=A0A2H5Y951_9CHLR|nr:hypothetical protein HRbin22_02203 [Candidatus Thermoflexus japonica]
MALHLTPDLLHALGQLFQGEMAVLVEGPALEPVRERQLGRQQDVLLRDLIPAFEGRMGPRRLQDHQIRSMTVHPQTGHQPGDQQEIPRGMDDLGKPLPGRRDLLGELAFIRLPLRTEPLRVLFEGQVAPQDLRPLGRIPHPFHVHTEGKAIQELGPQIPFLGVHGPHQDETGGMLEGDPLPLHHIHPHRRCVQQHIHDVIVEQIHLIHIQEAPVGHRQNPRLKPALPFLDRPLDVQGAHHTVLRGAHRQIHKTGPAPGHREGLATGGPLLAEGAPGGRLMGIAGEGAIGHHIDFGEKGRQGAGGRGLGGAPFPADQHPADLRVNRAEHQGAFHPLLIDDRRKWENHTHGKPPS